MQLFERSYVLTLTSRKDYLKAIHGAPPVSDELAGAPQNYALQSVRSTSGFEVVNLRVSAKIKSTSSNSNTNFTEIRIYNATPEIQTQLKKPNSFVTLAAGYKRDLSSGKEISKDRLPLIFSGDILESFTVKQGSESITTIRAKESSAGIRDSFISKVYESGDDITAILEDIVGNHMQGISVGEIRLAVPYEVVLDKQKLNGTFNAYGRAAEVLDELKKDFKFDWYIVANKFYAQPPNFGRAKGFIALTPANVIGSIQPAQGTTSGKKTQAGLKARVFLDGRVVLYNHIKLTGFGDDRDGEYKIREFSHDLDTRGSNWYTDLILEAV